MYPPDKLTKEIVIDFHKAVMKETNSQLVTFDDVEPFLDVADLAIDQLPGQVRMIFDMLSRLEVFDARTFLESTAITIPSSFFEKNVIYVPWVPGDKECGFIKLLAHEGQHAIRANAHKSGNWMTKYLCSFAFRTKEERKARQTEMEVHNYFYGDLSSFNFNASSPWLLRPTDEKVLSAGLKQVARPVEEGAIATEMGKFTVKWFKERLGDK